MTNSFKSGRARPRRRRNLAVKIGTAVFVVAALIALLMTLGGANELLDQFMAAPDSKSGFISAILGFGMVLLGPVLLVALAMLMPRQWVPRAFERLAHFFAGERTGDDHSRASR